MITLLLSFVFAHATVNDPIEAAVYSAMATGSLILQLSHGPQPDRKAPPEIYGHCYLAREGKPCPNTYIQFKNLISGENSRVWISNSDGGFTFPFRKGQKFELQAFVGEARSNKVTVTKASEVTLYLDTKPRESGP